MKTNKCLSLLATLAILFSLTPGVSAMNPQNDRLNISKFTPTQAEGRTGVNFIQGMLSFTYSTFNNFLYSNEGDVLSPRGAWNQGGVGSNQGDERRFLAGKHCDHLSNDKLTCFTDNNQQNNNYYNTIPTEFAEGDIVRFQIFFHNNGQDPYDGAGGSSPNAEDVRIGVDLNNIADPNAPEYLRPVGFIKSDDNQYRRDIVQNAQTGDITSTGATILDANGNPKHNATDDMEIKLTEAGMKLVPMPGHIFANLDAGNFAQFITQETQYTYEVEDGPGNSDTFTTTLTPHIDGSKIWLNFDEIPGCFRYAGWLVFDAVVVKPPVEKVCTNLDLVVENAADIDGKDARELHVENIDFNPDGTPPGSVLRWRAPSSGKFYSLANGSLIRPQTDVNGVQTIFTTTDKHVFYVNPGDDANQEVSVALLPNAQAGSYSEDCEASTQIPPQEVEKECVSINLVKDPNTVTIDGKVGYKLSVNNIVFNPNTGTPSDRKLHWYASRNADAKYYIKQGNNFIEQNAEPFITEVNQVVYFVNTSNERENSAKVEVVQVTADGPRLAPKDGCKGEVKIPFTPVVCVDLQVNHPQRVLEQTLSLFKAQSLNSKVPPTLFEGKIRYSVDPGFGYFLTENPGNLPNNPSPQVNEIQASIEASWDFIQGLFDNSQKFDIPLELGAFNPSDGMASSFVPGRQFGPDLSGAIDPSIFEPLQPDNPIDNPIDVEIQRAAIESIDVNANKEVYFFATKESEGRNVIHVDQLNPNGTVNAVAACQSDFPILPNSVCDALKVNHDAVINEGKVTTFTAKALDEQGRNFKGRITYSVDEGKGRFFLVDPGLTNNVSQRITEGVVANQPIPAPAGGFCGVDGAQIARDNGNINWKAIFDKANDGIIVEPSLADQPRANAENLPTGISGGEIEPGSLLDNIRKGTTESAIDPRDFIDAGALNGNEVTLINSNEIDNPINLYSGHDAESIPSSAMFQLKDYELINLTTNIATGNYYKPSITLDLREKDVNLGTPKYFLGNNVFNASEIMRRAQEINSSPKIIEINREKLNERFNLDIGNFVRNRSYQEVTVDPGTQVWFLPENISDDADGRNVIHVETTCTEVAGCKRDFSVKPGQEICQDFGMTVVPSDQLSVDQDATISLEPTDQEGNPLPEDTKIKITNTAGGRVKPNQERIQNNFLTLSQFPATLENTTKAGTVTLSVDPTDPSFSLACQGQITVTDDIAPECKALTYVIKEYFDGNQTDVLNENNMYEVSANVDFIGEVPNPAVDYSIPADYGTFVTLAEGPIGVAQSFGIKSLIINDNLSRASLEAAGFDTGSPVTAPELEAVYFVIFTDTPAQNGLTPNILKMSADGFGNIECQKSVPLKKDQQEEVKECLDLEIVNPDRPWEIDNNDENDTQLFQIRVRSNPEDFKNDLFYHWEVTGGGEWQDGDNTNDTLVDQGDTTKILENFDEDTEVEIYATATRNGDKIAECSDSISTTVEKEKKKPKISKYVYPEGKVDDKDNIINIGETRNTRFVTYMIAFTPADSKSVDIWEANMENNKIQSNGSLNGNLELEEMSINILSENDSRSYSFMRSEDYNEDRGDSSYADKNFDHNEDRKIFCNEDNHNKLCIDNADDVEEVMQKFGDGEPIKFKNLSDLDKGDQIIIKYRVANNSKVDNEVCKTLATDNGCGEEFDNTIRFKAYEDNDFDTELENGRDSAKVIVICPYVITRGGGDSFFHDIIDTGADVAQCSEVKSCEGACIKPPRERPEYIPKTGTGEIDKGLSLTLPSHDICKYSNSENNIEGYNDVLKNFSSTVCEVESEVAAIWKEKNINNAIAANIERLARFGSNLNGGELNTDVDNKESGVFISDGEDITIGENGTYTVEGGNGLPAAQTYIVRNADLHIKSNIVYGTTNFDDQTNIPSAAFIVIDGNIIIDNDVSRLDGIYMAVDLDKSDDGKVTNGNSGEDSQTALSIYGNLIGNVYELFATRKGYGDPTKDEGSVVIHYDSRILLNTPPGISDLIDIDQSLIPG